MTIPKWILPVIIISQFCCTSLWFASNAIIKKKYLKHDEEGKTIENGEKYNAEFQVKY